MSSRGVRRFGPGVAVAIVALQLAAAACADVTAETAAAPVLDDRYPRAKVSFGSDVESYPDVIYSTPAGFRPLRLDIYRQLAPKGPRPLVVYIHGGGWQNGSKESFRWLAGGVAATGNYVGISVGYRLTGEAIWPAQIHDCKAAIRWIRANAEKYKLDDDAQKVTQRYRELHADDNRMSQSIVVHAQEGL